MKYRFIRVLTVVLLAFLAVSCSDKKNDPYDPPATNIRLTKAVITTGYGVNSFLYLYDPQNRLIKVEDLGGAEEYTYNADNSLSKITYTGDYKSDYDSYNYANGRLDHIISYEFGGNSDTLFFFYDNAGKVIRTTIHKYNDSEYNHSETDFYYYGDGTMRLRAENTTTIRNQLLLKSLSYFDSTTYIWNSGNLIRTSQLTDRWNSGIRTKSETTYEYDAKPNYYKVAFLPEQLKLLLSLNPDDEMSANNCLKRINRYNTEEAETHIFNITYNGDGYPDRIQSSEVFIDLAYEIY